VNVMINVLDLPTVHNSIKEYNISVIVSFDNLFLSFMQSNRSLKRQNQTNEIICYDNVFLADNYISLT